MPVRKETLQRLAAELCGITLTEAQAESLVALQEGAMQGLARFPDEPLFAVEPTVRVRPVQAKAAGKGEGR